MEHDDLKARLSEYLDGELPEAERSAVEAHLTGCPSCREEVREWTLLRGKLFQVPARPAAAETEVFVRRLMARLPEEEAGEEAPLDYRWLMPALGFSFAALLFSFYPLSSTQADPLSGVLLADAGSAAPSGEPIDVVRQLLEGK
ncbi:MAG: zf-HC2 domain-containing protein [Elusimicrobiota bacterium]